MDCKEQLLRMCRTELIGKGIDPEKVTEIMGVLMGALAEFTVEPIGTALALNDNRNAQLIRGFIATLLTEGKSRRTVAVYENVLARFAQQVGVNLHEVTSYNVRLWLATMEQKVSLATCENYRAYLSSFYKWMTDEDIIGKNPMAKIKPIKHTVEVKLPFSAVEVDRLRSACDCLRNKAILEVLLSCGARVSELCAMNISDVELNQRRILIREGKGNKQRTVYIHDVCKDYIERYLAERSDSNPWLFASRNNSRLVPASVRKMLNGLSKAGGVPHVHPHRCRRTYATELARRGMAVQEIQRLMGHADINVTMRYIKLDDTAVEMSYKKCG